MGIDHASLPLQVFLFFTKLSSADSLSRNQNLQWQPAMIPNLVMHTFQTAVFEALGVDNENSFQCLI